LEQLEQLRLSQKKDELQQELKQSFTNGAALIVARAAVICREERLADLESELVESWGRFRDPPSRLDKGCKAKTALALTAVELDFDCVDLYLEGIHLRQPEPVWGGTVDTAAELRAVCASGLAQSDYPEAVVELAELLADSEPEARTGAVRALAQLDPWRAEPLLRFKLLLGDDDEKVIGDCCLALLRLSPDSAMPFVSHLLDSDNTQIAEAVALSMGESRLEKCLIPLQHAWEGALEAGFRRTLLLSIAMLHNDSSRDFLLELVEKEALPVAEMVVNALSMYRHDEELLQSLQSIATSRADGLDAVIRRAFLLER
jgi:HEAT repeat protein